MSFSTVIQGDIGSCVSDYLNLESLNNWSRCDRTSRENVERKYDCYKLLNLDEEYKSLSQKGFARMCARLRGIEVLRWSIDYPLFIRIDHERNTEDAYVAESHGVNISSRLFNNLMPNYPVLRDFYSLLIANISSLRVVHQSCLDESTPTQGLSHHTEDYHTNLLAQLSQFMPRLEVLVTATSVNVQKLIESQVEIRSKLEHEDVEMPETDLLTFLPSKLLNASRLLTPQQYEQYSLLAPITYTYRQVSLQALRILGSISATKPDLLKLIEMFPEVEAVDQMLFKGDFSAATTDGATTGAASEEVQSDNNSLIQWRLEEDDRLITLPHWSSLINLQLNIDSLGLPTRTRYAILSLRLPHLLSLRIYTTISTWATNTISPADIVLECPELLSLACEITCVQRSQEDPAVDTSFLIPPSFLTSLRHSPKLRSLRFNQLAPVQQTPGVTTTRKRIPDFISSLTAGEMKLIKEKAAKHGREGIFAFGVDEEDKIIKSSILLYYILSLLPLSTTLETIDGTRSYMKFEEYFTLFPSMKSYSLVPVREDYLPRDRNPPNWLRPSGAQDIGGRGVVSAKHLVALEQEFSFHPDFECEDFLHVVDNNTEIDVKLGAFIAESGRFDSLTRLFLAAPTKVDEEALTMVFIACKSLAHVSLIQLAGVGNTTFTSMPTDCIRPCLETLRIWSSCEKTSASSSLELKQKPFDASILPRLSEIFPALMHLDFLLTDTGRKGSDGEAVVSEVHTTLHRLLAATSSFPDLSMMAWAISCGCIPFSPSSGPLSLLWPRLRTLTINRDSTDVVTTANCDGLSSGEYQLLLRKKRESIVSLEREAELHSLLLMRSCGRNSERDSISQLGCSCSLDLVSVTSATEVSCTGAAPSSTAFFYQPEARRVISSRTFTDTHATSTLTYHTQPCCRLHI